MKFFYYHTVRGLSLVEIIVVLGLFSGVATIALGALFNTKAINNKLVENQSILDNVNMSLQIIVRDIRYGAEFYCNNDYTKATTTRNSCPASGGGGNALAFLGGEATHANDRTTYYVENGLLYKRDVVNGATSTYQMTTDDITITEFKVYVDGANSSNGTRDALGSSDYLQPKITLLISGKAKTARPTDTPATFSVQTTISPRLLDSI